MESGFLSSLPAGYRFKPKDEELVDFYLKRKIYNRRLPPNIFRDVDLYNYDPHTLTAMNDNPSSNGAVTEWYFFTPRDRKYPKGNRPMRSAGGGYWKPTGKPNPVLSKGKEVGSKRSLAFFRGKSPHGEKTNWIMHEYVLNNAPQRKRLSTKDMQLDDWVLCRVYKKKNEQRPKPGTPVEGSHDRKHEETDNGAIVAQTDVQPDPLDTLMPQGPQQLQQYPEAFGSVPGHNSASFDCQEAIPMASMLPYHQFQPQMLQSQQFFDTNPSNVDFQADDWFIYDTKQNEADNVADVTQFEDQMLGNGVPYDDLNALMSQQTFSMPFPNENGEYMLGQNSANFDTKQNGANIGADVTQFEDQMLENVIPSDELNALLSQQTFSMPFQYGNGDYKFGQIPENFDHQEVVFDQYNFVPTSAPLASMPLYHQFQPRHVLPPLQLSGADEARSKEQVQENGTPPLLQYHQIDARALNKPVPRQTR